MVVKPSISGDGFEVGDMVWAKMKSQPWWPGHVYSEEFATPLVRRSKREGLLLVALFGASSYAWFDPSELKPFDSSYAGMCMQSNSRTFVKAVEDAVVEVNRRIGLGMSCMCRDKQNFRKIDVQGFVVADVAGYDSGAVYSIAAIGKARDSFQPNLALDFIRQLALEPDSSEHVDDIEFIKNKATIMSYRKAAFEDFDEPYDLASIQEPASKGTPFKASPLSGMAVLADSLGKVLEKTAKLEKGKVASSLLPVSSSISAAASGEFALKDATGTGCLEDTLPTVLEYSIAESFTSSVAEVDQAKVKSADDEKRIVQQVADGTQDDFSRSDKIATFQTVKIPRLPVGSSKKFPTKITGQPEGPRRSDDNYDTDLSRVLADLRSLAVDPYNRGTRAKGKKVFLRFRSLVFQKSKNFLLPLANGEPNASEDNVKGPPVKPLKRGLSDCQEEMNVSKKKKVGDIRKLTDVINNKIDGHPTRDVKQLEPGPTILSLKFQQGGYLPSFNELKARFARYGPLDHSATQIFRNSFSCQVVFRNKAHAEAAYRFVVGSSSLFGNTDVKCSLKNAAEPEPSVRVPKDPHQPATEPSMVPAASSVLQMKSILKTSGGEEELFADSLGKVMNPAKPTFKPRNETKEIEKDEEKVTSSSILLVGESGEKKKQKKELISLFPTQKTGHPQISDDLLRVLDDLHSLAVDPFNTVNRGSHIKGKKVFLRFRSLVFQKGQNFSLPLAGGGPNASKSSTEVPLSVKRPGGLKRGPSDHHQEEMVAKKAGDIKNLTKEKKVTKMLHEPPTGGDVKQSTLKKPGPGVINKLDQRGPEPTMLTIKFPQGGYLPSYNELKARFARYGPMDHSGTHIFWNTFSCQVVFRYKVHAQAAYRFVVGSSSLFGNAGVKCTLKEVGTLLSSPVEVSKENHHQPDRPPNYKSILKKSGGEEAAGKGGRGRVTFLLGGISSSTSISSHLTLDVSSNNFEKVVHPSVTSPTGSCTPPSMHYGTKLLSPPSLPPVSSCSRQMTLPLRVPDSPLSDPLATTSMDITEEMLSLLIRCNDVVTNVTSILGYSPYHPL